jgi:hypothetical protein
MAIPRKLLRAALAALPVKTLRAMAEWDGVRGRDTMTPAQLVERLGWDSSNLAGYTMHMSAADLKEVADVFGIEDPGRSKGALSNAVWVFIVDYDKNQKLAKAGLKKSEARDVFGLAGKPGFGKALWAWTEGRWNKIGYKKLTPGEQTIWRVRWMFQEVDHGDSFAGYFENADDDMPIQVVDDLKKIGAPKSAAALRKIGKMFFPRGVPARQSARERAMQGVPVDDLWDECYEIWNATREDLAELSVEYAARHPKLFGA